MSITTEKIINIKLEKMIFVFTLKQDKISKKENEYWKFYHKIYLDGEMVKVLLGELDTISRKNKNKNLLVIGMTSSLYYLGEKQLAVLKTLVCM